MILLALIVLVAAVIVGVTGVLNNAGSAHALTHGFSVFGYHVTGSTGTLFLYGIVVGAVAALGLSLLLASARRASRRGRVARHSLKQSRRETAAASRERDDLTGQRDDLIDQRETARAQTARHSLKQSRRETAAASRERDDLIDQRETAGAQTAPAQENGPVASDREHSAGGAR
jgi:gas vesicle protein